MYPTTKSRPTPAGTGRGRPQTYPLAELAVGESFSVPAGVAMNARLAASARKRLHAGWNYTSRTESDGSVRIWRTA